MPTVLRVKGYKFIIFTNDHPAPHIHVKRAEGGGKIRLEPIEVIEHFRLNRAQRREILELVEEHLDYLLEKWRELHGEQNG